MAAGNGRTLLRVLALTALVLPSAFAANMTVAQIQAHLLQGYDKQSRPDAVGVPTMVDQQFYLTSLFGMDQVNMQISVMMYWRLYWDDPRLAYDHLDSRPQMPMLANDIWKPDVYVDNSVSTSVSEDLLLVYPSGSIWWSRFVLLKVSCPMHFGDMPFDYQDCPIVTAPYSMDGNEVELRWRDDKPVIVGGEMDMPEWTLLGADGYVERLMFGETPWYYATAQLNVERQTAYYLFAVIIPVAFFNLLGYSSFWIDRRLAPPRVMLGTIPVLITVSQANMVRSKMPNISYETWIGNYLLGATLINILVMVEYALVHTLHRYEVKLKDHAMRVPTWRDMVSGGAADMRAGGGSGGAASGAVDPLGGDDEDSLEESGPGMLMQAPAPASKPGASGARTAEGGAGASSTGGGGGGGKEGAADPKKVHVSLVPPKPGVGSKSLHDPTSASASAPSSVRQRGSTTPSVKSLRKKLMRGTSAEKVAELERLARELEASLHEISRGGKIPVLSERRNSRFGNGNAPAVVGGDRGSAAVNMDDLAAEETHPIPEWVSGNFDMAVMTALQEAFKAVDVDGDGTLERSELSELMRALGVEWDTKAQKAFLLTADLDLSGAVDLDEFLYGVAVLRPEPLLPHRTRGARARLQWKRAQYAAAAQLNAILRLKLSAFIDNHSRWVFLLGLLLFNIFMLFVSADISGRTLT
mmetsp:Transcript_19697/g.64047  ORF Transcript_19697/g.64047 Transcript_19697/m.64047 type:complete len:696 (-) Transcript_19697:120-2207(-)|eukprot:CAMPEP_0170157128 /NCGR_PEP_ID=MMETSP0033_2-20121228/65031_1 /TAXON_ID=195969 /ORGANISM="Dolichomastix tenuilepis, Strain CCMP3274" /LENGTH=695 /DNA_ID=CAMNT_0010394519 /DNA_START=47 /DNA_END=2134 /DNA_ORIENTATION=-